MGTYYEYYENPAKRTMTIIADYGAISFDMHFHIMGESKWMFINGADSITVYEAVVENSIVTALNVVPFDSGQLVSGETEKTYLAVAPGITEDI